MLLMTTFISSSHPLASSASLAPSFHRCSEPVRNDSRCGVLMGYIVGAASNITFTSDADAPRLPSAVRQVSSLSVATVQLNHNDLSMHCTQTPGLMLRVAP